MSRDISQTFVIGRLVKDPEIKYLPSGTPITKFSIANNETYKQGNEYKEYTNYFDVNVWGNQGLNCEKYLKKGNQVAITGSLRQNRWKDKNGQMRSKIEITALQVQFLQKSNQSQNKQPENNQQNNINDPWDE